MNTVNVIFSESFLSNYLYDFKLSSIPNIREIQIILRNLIEELKSGKLERLKEEEIKSRFITSFFGDVLGFNYGNSNQWMLREEKKSEINGSKSDAALGYFFENKEKDDVRTVIEIKDAKTDLDKNQNRSKNFSPVEQAFNYAPQMKGNCKWVIVSNVKEIRFYPSNDRSKCQVFFLEDLENETKLKELLFLFHKDRFIRHNLKDRSNTDILFNKSIEYIENESLVVHIIDKIYYSLKRFEDLGFVSPEYIASIKPFNILDEYVWHYQNEKLFTINSDIYFLLNEISIIDSNIIFSEKLEKEIDKYKVLESKEKLKWSFKFLNNCMITEMQAIKDYSFEVNKNKRTIGFSKKNIFNTNENNYIVKNIQIKNNKDVKCDCIICNYRNFKFDNLIRRLRKNEGNRDYNNLQYAFGNFLVSSNNYKNSYTILKEIQSDIKQYPEKGITYFLATFNLTLLYNLIQSYDLDDKEKIRSEIRNIDLDKLIYNELEFYIENDVITYLKKIKDDDYIDKIKDSVDNTYLKIIDLKDLLENNRKLYDGPNYAYKLLIKLHQLSLYLYNNNLFYFKFTKYKQIFEKIFAGLLLSHNTPDHGLLFFNDFVLTETILNVPQSNLQKLLRNQKTLRSNEDSIIKLLEKFSNMLTSYCKDGYFNDSYENSILTTQLENWGFRDLYTSIFANAFTILSRLELSKEQFQFVRKALITFLKIETILAWFDLKEFETFLVDKGDFFEIKELEEILHIAITRDKMFNNKYEGLLKKIPTVFDKFYPEYQFCNTTLLNRAVYNCHSESNDYIDYRKIIGLATIVDENCKKILLTHFQDYLNKNFNYEFYEKLLENSVLDIDTNNYFEKYVLEINNKKDYGTYRFGKQELTDLIFINFILLIYELDIDFEKKELLLLSNVNEFEAWLLNPKHIDYHKFDVTWLYEIHEFPNILSKMGNISEIANAIDKFLLNQFDSILLEIKYKYFIR
ncbi:hypothetical protein [Chryseobacterium sp.]|uniref:hypothetical protein n=1 Tax=Chryseobacterium sp. TaxID=1871047 RepID=UPI00333F6B46